MDVDKYLRYVSVAALIVSPDHKHFLICRRSDTDDYEAGSVVFPSGRVEGNEKLKERLLLEIGEEVGIAVDERSITYIDECTFPRQGVPVNQLCFGIDANETKVQASKELKSLQWVSPEEFYKQFEEKGYVAELFKFVRKAKEIRFLR